MGYTILDCFLCAFSSQADNSLSKKSEMFVQLIFCSLCVLKSATGLKETESYFQLHVFSAIYGNLFLTKPLDLKPNTKICNNISLINSRKKETC